MKTQKFEYLFMTSLLLGTSAFGTMIPTPAETLSSGGTVTGTGQAFKTKLVRMGNGMLVTAYGDSVASAHDVYDLKADDVRKARDVFVRTCMPTDANDLCSNQADWSAPVNISNTADLTSATTKWRQNDDGTFGAPEAFYGDSDKPNIFNSGTFAVVSWVDKYCPGGEQRMVSYNERAGLTVPFSCTYESHINFADANATWDTNQLSSGIRDAKQDVNKGASFGKPGVGKWVVTWQEDPHGLQIGAGDGPGDGASGADATHGTDIWYAYTEDLITSGFTSDKIVRLTDNHTQNNNSGNASPIYDVDDATVEIETLDSGNTAATRANTMIVANGTAVPMAVIAYEETKGTEKLDSGKMIRYHNFAFNNPDINASGTILSEPEENSRRVRFVTQVATPTSGLKMGIFWRQGTFNGGGPGDIMVRLGFKNSADASSTGLRPEDMIPAVDPNAAAADYTAALLLNNTPGFNISSNTVPWTPVGGAEGTSTNDLTDATLKNPYEDARAHRAVIRGEDFYIGYSYTKDWAVATYTDMDNYNFWMRRYDASLGNWVDTKNLSNITDKKIHVKEPRLVGMPGNGTGCTDDSNITIPENCQNPSTLLVAWGVESNVYDHIGGAEEGDVFYTRTTDKGASYEDIVVVPGLGNSNRYESQLRSTPAGNIVFSVWNETDNDNNGTYSKVSVFKPQVVVP